MHTVEQVSLIAKNIQAGFFMVTFRLANRIKTARYNKDTDFEKYSKETSMSVNLLIDFSRGSYKIVKKCDCPIQKILTGKKCIKKFLSFFS